MNVAKLSSRIVPDRRTGHLFRLAPVRLSRGQACAARGAFPIIAVVLTLLLFAMLPRPAAAQTVILAQNHPAAAASLTGRTAAGQPLTLHIAFALRNRAKLDDLLAAQQKPASAKFHRWLTPAQFNQRFGRTAAEVSAVSRWLTDNGFQITAATARGLTANGTAALAETAFHTTIAESADGSVYANLTDPEIPAGFASIIGAIDGLDNTRHAMPMVQRALSSSFPSTAAVPLPAAAVALNELIGGGSNPGTAFGPSDFWTFYDENTLLNAGTNGGGGDCIALIEDSDYLPAAVTLFDTTFALPAASITNVFPDTSDPGVNGDEAEALLDIEWAHAVASGAPIRVYIGSGSNALPDAIARAITDNACGSIGISYAICGSSSSFFTGSLDPLFAQAATQGQSILVAAGDYGSAGMVGSGCIAGTTQNVSEMAADPNVTAVGGTQFSPAYDSSGDVTGAIAESIWNDQSGATGGGKSAIFSKPSFQAVSTPSDSRRDVPDVAYGASPSYPGYYFGNDDGGTAAIDCCIGGTSIAASMWAGLIKLVNQGSGRAGNIDTRVYQLGAAGTSASFRDVTTSNDTTNKSPGNNAYNGVTGFTAVAGYDQSTGWGTADVTNFVEAFPAASSSPTPSPTPTLTPSPTPSAAPTQTPSPSPSPSATPTPISTPTPPIAELQLSPGKPINFKNVKLGKTALKTLHVKAVYRGLGKRPAGAALQGLTLQVSNAAGSAFALARTTCGAALLAGKSCQVWLSFTPAAAGLGQGVFEAAAAASSQSPSVSLTGNGVAPKPAK